MRRQAAKRKRGRPRKPKASEAGRIAAAEARRSKYKTDMTVDEKVKLIHTQYGKLPKHAVKAELARRSLHRFIKEFWHVLSGDPFADNWHIKYICDEIEQVFWRVKLRKDKLYDLVINVPPGTTKSTIVAKMFPVWAWLNDPVISFITGSYSSPLALEHSDASRDIMGCEQFKEWYPWIAIKPGQDTKSKYQNHWADAQGRLHNGGKRFTTSVGGTVTGMHGHIIIIDDPINPLDAEMSESLRKEANVWVDRTLSSRKSIKQVTPIIMIMQRLHQDDPTGHYLGMDIPVKHIKLPGEIRAGDKNTMPNPPELAEFYVNGLLDPDRLGRVTLDDMLTQLGQFGYAGQVDQHPIPPGGGMFKTQQLRILSETPERGQTSRRVMYWDKAATPGGGDYTVGVLMWEMKGKVSPKYIIIKIVRGQWDSHERERRIKEEANICGRDVQYIVEQEPGSGGKESAESTIRNLAGFKVKADRPTGDKQLRSDVFSVQVNNGNVGIVNGPWLELYKEEMEFFPLGKYDDQVDASAGAFNQLAVTKKGGAW